MSLAPLCGLELINCRAIFLHPSAEFDVLFVRWAPDCVIYVRYCEGTGPSSRFHAAAVVLH